MTKAQDTKAIEKATVKPWSEWVELLDKNGARDMTHADIAKLAHEMLEGTVNSTGWWAQGVTVAYEQHIGSRVPGQLANGLFEIAVSKTIAGTRDEVFARVVDWFGNQKLLHEQTPSSPRTSATPKRSTWRCNFADGNAFSATVEDASNNKSKLVFAHTNLPDKNSADSWKAFWRTIIEQFVQ